MSKRLPPPEPYIPYIGPPIFPPQTHTIERRPAPSQPPPSPISEERDPSFLDVIHYIRDAPNWTDRTNRLREAIGRFISPLAGLDYNDQAAQEAKGILQQMLVFHGSPHTFEKFDISKIGTGEGFQAYGHGLYFAENPETAGTYQRQLSGSTVEVGGKSLDPIAGTPEWNARRHLEWAVTRNQDNPFPAALERVQDLKKAALSTPFGPRSDYLEELDRSGAVLRQWQKSGARIKAGGHLYQAHIPDEQAAKMLDWDQPISRQHQDVRAVLKQLGFEDRRYYTGGEGFFNRAAAEERANQLRAQLASSDPRYQHIFDVVEGEPDVSTGQEVYNHLKIKHGDAQAASAVLQKSGIPGIRYFDQGSRAAGTGTHNVVVFDPEILKNVKRQ